MNWGGGPMGSFMLASVDEMVSERDEGMGAKPRTREGDKDEEAQGRAASEIELSVEKAMWLDCSRGDPEAAADLELLASADPQGRF